MAMKVLILGDSGTGKSASLRNFDPAEVLVINCAGKPLPFKNKFEARTPRFERLTEDVISFMKEAKDSKKRVLVVDDAQYIMSFQYMRRIKENGWDKWNDIQGDFFNVIKLCDELPNDMIVYFLSHIQRDESGRERIKTMGKMLDEKITIEGLFTTVLKTAVNDGQYSFVTQNSGFDTVKSPIGMFDSYAIDNDLKYVDTKIRNYYEMGDYVPDEQMVKMDEEAAKPDVEKPETGTRKRRARKATTTVEANESDSKPVEEAPVNVETMEPEKTVTDDSTPDETPKKRVRKRRNIEEEAN